MQTKDQGEKGMNEKGTKSPYADTLSRQLPSTHTGTLAWIQACNRQILIDKSPDAPAKHLSYLDEGKLVEKANEAMTKMSTQSRHPPTEIRIIGAKKLQNGGIAYKLNNLESTLWLRKEKVEFMKHYRKALVIKDKSVSVIVEYIPVAHNPDALGESKKKGMRDGTPSQIDRIHKMDQTNDKKISGSMYHPPHNQTMFIQGS